jgi:hypothetical protein
MKILSIIMANNYYSCHGNAKNTQMLKMTDGKTHGSDLLL